MYIFGQAVQERGISQVVMSRARTRTLLIARVHAAAQSRQHLVRLRVDGVDATGVDLGACVQRRAGNLHQKHNTHDVMTSFTCVFHHRSAVVVLSINRVRVFLPGSCSFLSSSAAPTCSRLGAGRMHSWR